MSAEQIFALCNPIALAGWILLIATPRRGWASTLVAGRLLPLLLADIYLTLLATHWGEGHGGFGALSGVAALFSNHWLLLAGWIHYLAFDLFVGSWEVRDAELNSISHWLVIPCLVLTFLFGPVGLLSYFAVRSAAVKLRSGE
jgi:hypothetical protein